MTQPAPGEGRVLVIGASGVDIVGRPAGPLAPGTSNRGSLRMSDGGVARNVAENLARLGTSTVLLTAVADDTAGARILENARQAGIDTGASVTIPGGRTGTYLALLEDTGSLHAALDDMRIIEQLTPEHILQAEPFFVGAAAVFLDANLPPASLDQVLAVARRLGIRVAADPTSSSLAPRLAPHLRDLWLLTPNEAEAQVLTPHAFPHADRDQALDAARHLVAAGVEIAVIALAEFGAAYASSVLSGHVPALRTDVVDSTGVGDAMSAAVIFGLLNDIPLDESVRLGVAAAGLTLRTPGTVVPDLSLELLYHQLR
jgi:pseudouridine kinase